MHRVDPDKKNDIEQSEQVVSAGIALDRESSTSREPRRLAPEWLEIRREFIPELKCPASLWRHRAGIEALFVHSSDSHRYFGVAFKTLPTSNQGEPHIAEHMIFRGSEKYPSQEPFSAYLKASLYTDSNAYTGHDYTLYHHSSPDEGDFLNQIHLIMNSVFKPLLREDSFREEAWRIDQDKDGIPYLNGIVLNEMKGAASDPEQVHEMAVNIELLKDTPFIFNAGGVPSNIPSLTVNGLREWVDKFYTPANCRVFIYGAGDPETLLAAVGEHVPDTSSKLLNEENILLESTAPILLEDPREFQRIKRVTHFYPGGETEDASRDSVVTVNWRLKQMDGNPLQELATQVLFNAILCGNDTSPLREALLDSGLGEDIFGGRVSFDTPYPIFTIGLSGAAAHRAEEIESLIEQSIDQILTDGLTDDLIERSLDTVTYQEKSTLASAELGSELGQSVLLAMIRGTDPFRSLYGVANIDELRKAWREKPSIFVDIFRESIGENKNRVTLTLKPNRALVHEAEENERELSQHIYNANQANFAELTLDNPGERDTLRDQSSLPKLKISEISFPASRLEEIHREDNLIVHEAQTHGMGFVDVSFSIRGLEMHQVADAAILSELFITLDNQKITWRKFIEKFNYRSTLDCELDVFQNHRTGGVDARIMVSIAAEAEALPKILETVFNLPHGLQLDNRKRVVSLLKQSQANYEGDIYADGMLYAIGRAQAHQDLASYVRDVTAGIGYIQTLRSTIKEARTKWGPVLERLELVSARLALTADVTAQITADRETLNQALPTLRDLCATAKNSKLDDKPVWRVPNLPQNEGFIIPATVNFVGQSFDVFDHKSIRTVEVVANHLRNAFLWDNVRRSGGAYSTDLDWDMDARVIAFGSGRDPAPLKSIQIFKEIPTWLRSRFFGAEELRRSIINPLGQLIAPKSLADQGNDALINFLKERPASFKSDLFERIKETTSEDVESFADSLERSNLRGAPIVVVGSHKSMKQLQNHYGESLVSVELLE